MSQAATLRRKRLRKTKAQLVDELAEMDERLASSTTSSANDTDARGEIERQKTYFEAVFQDVADAVVLTDPKRRIVMCNPALSHIFGYDSKEILGRKTEVLYADPKDFKQQGRVRFNPKAEAQPKPYLVDYRRKDGEPFPGETVGAPVCDNEGHTLGYLGIIRDISERAQAEKEEARISRALENLAEGLAFYDADDRLVFCNEEYRRVHPLIRDLLKPGARFEDLVRAHAERGAVPEAKGREKSYIRERMKLHRHPKGPIIRELADDIWFIIKEGRTPDGGTYAITTDITQLKKVETDLRRSQEQFVGAVAALQEGFALYDSDDRLVVCNDEYRRLHPKMEDILKSGMLFEDLVRSGIKYGVNADAIGREEEHIQERMEFHRRPKGPIVRTLTDGTKFLIKESRTSAGGVVVTETDITERSRAREASERLSQTIENVPVGIALFDGDDRLVFFNSRYAELMEVIADVLKPGATFEEIVRAIVTRQPVQDARGREEEYIRERMERHRNPTGPLDLRRGDKWLQANETRMPDGSIFIIITDITERKRIEELSKDAVESIPDGFALYDADDRLVLFNKNFLQGRPGLEDVLKLGMTFEEQSRLREKLGLRAKHKGTSSIPLEERIEKHRNPKGSYEAQLPDGQTFQVHEFKTHAGGTAIIRTDITERVRAEEDSRRLAAAIEGLSENFALYGADDRLIVCNEGYRRLNRRIAEATTPGTSFEEHLRAMVEKGLVPETAGREEEWIEERLERHRNPKGPFELLRQDGIWLLVNDQRMADGSTATISTDITDRRRAEQALRTSEARLRGAIDSMQEGFVLFDADDRLVTFNEVYRQINPAAQEFLQRGMRYEDLTRANVKRGRIVEAIGREEAFIRERMEQHHNPKDPIIRHMSDGKCYIIKEVRTPEGGTALTFIDITERKQAEEALRESEESYRILFENAAAGIGRSRIEDGKVLMANKKLGELFGYDDPAQFVDEFVFSEHYVLPQIREQIIAGYEKEPHRVTEVSFTTQDGSVIIVANQGWVDRDAGHIDFVMIDITDLKQAEAALRESEERFRDVAESAGDWIWEMGPDLRFTFLSKRFFDFFPVPPEQIIGKTRDEFAGATRDDERWRRHLSTIANQEPFRDFEYAATLPSGHVRYIRISGKPVFDEAGRFKGYRGTGTDVTVAVELEAAAAKAEAQLLDAVESITAGFALFDRDDRLVLCNTRYRGLHPAMADLAVPGTSFQELIEGAIKAGIYHDSMGPPETWLKKRMAYHRNTPSSHEQQYADGRWLEINEYKTHEQGTVLIWNDITERRQAEQALRESEDLLNSIFENIPVGLLIKGPDHIVERANDTYLRWYGFDADTMEGRRSDEIEDFQTTEEAESMNAQEREVLTTGQTQARLVDRPFADGQIHTINITKFPVYDQQGNITKIGSVSIDLTEQVQARKALAHSEIRFRDFAESSSDWLWEMDERLRFTYFSERTRDIAGFDPTIYLGKTRREITPENTGDEKWRQHYSDLENRRSFRDFRYDLSRPAGGFLTISISGKPVFDEDGNFRGYRGSGTDITEQRMLERQLAGSQRMEALGNLTGGVAHDFNNLLTVILGNLQLLERRLPDQQLLKRYVELATGAADRGAELTKRLLAFARRQKLDVTVFDINGLIAGMDTLIRGTLGETIALETRLADGLWPVKADPTQLENALLNLMINAIDAMPRGGTFTIETTNVVVDKVIPAQYSDVVPGDYVLIAVGDTGSGMSSEVADHAFEPFFTTKEVEKGTGLGLSLVYGFVKQSDGNVKIYSEEDHGTVVKLYLPRFLGDGAMLVDNVAADKEPVGGGETILVVEDKPDVRRTAVSLLEDLGYRVIEAEDGPSALRVLDRQSGIDLLLTDVVMPGGMKGTELAREVQKRHSGMKVLYMSGYTEYGALRDDTGEIDGAFLSKPFQKGELADKLRRTLDG